MEEKEVLLGPGEGEDDPTGLRVNVTMQVSSSFKSEQILSEDLLEPAPQQLWKAGSRDEQTQRACLQVCVG